MSWLARHIPYFRDDSFIVTPYRCVGCASVVSHVEGHMLECKRCGHAGNFRVTPRFTRYERLLLYLGVR